MKSQEQCKGCVYWKSGAGGAMWEAMYMCHHLLVTGKRRVDKDGECLSKTTKENNGKKKVKAVEDNIVFESMTAAAKHYNLTPSRVCEITNKPNRTARGQHFITV